MHDVAMVWFRRDLRLHDNPAWDAACASGRSVAALFVVEPVLWRSSPRRSSFVAAALVELDAALRERGGALRVVHGDPAVEVPRAAADLGATIVHAGADVTPHAARRDAAVEAALAARGVDMGWWWGSLVHEPGSVRTAKGTLSQVFTPFHRRWAALERASWPAPPAIPPPTLDAAVGPLPADDGTWRAGVHAGGAGESGALERLAAFQDVVDRYERDRDRPDVEGTSRLGVDLHIGTISPRRVVDEIGDATSGRAALVRQLAWRDWWAHLLSERPELVARPMRPAYEAIRWEDDPEGFDAWCEGRTGYPIVDAGMRQLSATGWVHNRVRMIVASFLIKDLLVDWRRGERFFRRHLLDGDVAQNVGSWQWVAGTGPDAAPYFRIFNPVTQGRRFDPHGDYVARWVPEVAGLRSADRHAPWEAAPVALAAAGVVLGDTYPAPIVDHAEARERALAAYGAARAR